MQTPDHTYGVFMQFLTAHFNADEEQLKTICSKFSRKTAKRNEILLASGEVCKHLYFVNSGCLRIYLLDLKGNESTRFLVTEGKFGTSFPSYRLQEPSVAAIQSLELSDLFYISYHDFQALLDEIPAWEHIYRIALEQEYISSIQRIESLISMNATMRYQALMESNPSIIQRFPSKIIADYLGISQETLSRLKSKK
ncbi:cAMP-binding domain of CRP or a regulatory subunit of cAMP-dependent protein kinases [Pedobacter westerhofensis]|uniref:cAMP-binding domain of CRP or a regulatory subunit of cAMP-dependent protein kinases n=1 Tax=Pedobacter westerhofensis TaxID=425512 RepID=A0A521FDW0_9SPHI|nr:Crp/Fnr family transcriptional regulator [Pedobacter westerhofensis]SMO94398.1 cAMP-binding domain of CRP or a regulatory subunit of cAMP-dependent protein kinases [Pedobacter westerhofensis]